MQTQVLEKLRTLYEGIRDERGTHANTATRIGNAFLALLSYLAGAPFLRKDQDDSTPHKLTMGAAEVGGDASIKGVPGTGSPINMQFLDPAGAKTGKLFPTGNKIDVIDVPGYGPIEATLLDCSNPTVFVRARDLGIKGSEL